MSKNNNLPGAVEMPSDYRASSGASGARRVVIKDGRVVGMNHPMTAKLIALQAVTAYYPPQDYSDIVHGVAVDLGLRDDGEILVRSDAIQASCMSTEATMEYHLSLIHISEPTRPY